VKTIGAAKFKQHCLALLDEVDREGIVITKHGKPVAKLTAIAAEPAHLIGSLKGRIAFKGNILSTGLRWDAEPRHARPAARRRG
jgi:prevent-host-death family protein